MLKVDLGVIRRRFESLTELIPGDEGRAIPRECDDRSREQGGIGKNRDSGSAELGRHGSTVARGREWGKVIVVDGEM